jgi:uncharacterized Zn finger protein (UPF0148 family)
VSRTCSHCGEIFEEEGRLVCPHCGADVDLTYAEDPEEADFEPEEGEKPGGREPGDPAPSGCALLPFMVAIWAIL